MFLRRGRTQTLEILSTIGVISQPVVTFWHKLETRRRVRLNRPSKLNENH